MKNAEIDLPTESSRSVRRVPSQRRSRERVERILTIATDLIVEKGSDAVRMSEIAELAGISIGSLYQYFPDKVAIIRTLAERYNLLGRACVEAGLATVRQEADLESALEGIVDGYYAMFLDEPVMRDIWLATQSDKSLQEVDTADGEMHVALLNEVLIRLRPEGDRDELIALARLTTHLMATAVRLAISVEREQGDRIIATFKRMLPEKLLGILA